MNNFLFTFLGSVVFTCRFFEIFIFLSFFLCRRIFESNVETCDPLCHIKFEVQIFINTLEDSHLGLSWVNDIFELFLTKNSFLNLKLWLFEVKKMS